MHVRIHGAAAGARNRQCGRAKGHGIRGRRARDSGPQGCHRLEGGLCTHAVTCTPLAIRPAARLPEHSKPPDHSSAPAMQPPGLVAEAGMPRVTRGAAKASTLH